MTAVLGVTSAAGIPTGDSVSHDDDNHTSSRGSAFGGRRVLQTMHIDNTDWSEVIRTGLTNQVKICTPQVGNSDHEQDCLVGKSVVAALEADSRVSGEDTCY